MAKLSHCHHEWSAKKHWLRSADPDYWLQWVYVALCDICNKKHCMKGTLIGVKSITHDRKIGDMVMVNKGQALFWFNRIHDPKIKLTADEIIEARKKRLSGGKAGEPIVGAFTLMISRATDSNYEKVLKRLG